MNTQQKDCGPVCNDFDFRYDLNNIDTRQHTDDDIGVYCALLLDELKNLQFMIRNLQYIFLKKIL